MGPSFQSVESDAVGQGPRIQPNVAAAQMILEHTTELSPGLSLTAGWASLNNDSGYLPIAQV